ncbi:hypothetical protein UlMin_034254 [Ulmus minor]
MEAQVRAFMVALIVLLIQSSFAQEEALSSGKERLALLDLRSSLGLRGKDWRIKSDPCKWVGVKCRSGQVVGINVSGLRRTRVGRLQPQFAIDSLRNLTHLESFNASGFLLPGAIPDWIGQNLSALRVLDLRSAAITGPIPSSLGSLGSLNSLFLSGNDLSGSVPSSLGQLANLSILDLSRNSLTGSIPSGFSSLLNLTLLDLSSNFLSGSIPSGLGNLSRLKSLNVSDNSLTAFIPVQLGELSQLVELNLSKNFLSGSLPSDLKGLKSLKRIDVGGNELEGPWPKDLFSSLVQLQVIVLRGNKFDGAIPDFWLIPNLSFFDASSNNFTGQVPTTISNSTVTGAVVNLSNNFLYGNLTSLLGKFSSIDVSSNYFGGVGIENLGNATLDKNCLQTLPNQKSLQDCSQFYAERGLDFDENGVLRPDNIPSLQPESKSKNRLTFILVGIFGGLGFILVLVFVLVWLLKLRNKTLATQRGSSNAGPVKEEDSQLPKDHVYLSGLGESFTSEQILHFTSDFSETNLIKRGHSGDLFKGYLERRIPVVIKRVDLSCVNNESYMTELDFFRKVSHVRLVPLLGHCLESENEKFLVYKYMPNGDLANSLHRVITNSENESSISLDWITRLKIATGAAEVLAYLHHECTPPLVHRDVQASSILLDDKFEVRLGSLSEVHAQEGDANQNVLTRLLRKPSIPEQGTSVSSVAICAQDVYCFGKVLLELVTGKLGISKVDDASTREWLDHTLRYVSIYEKELVTKIVDPSLIVDEDLLEEVWAMAIVARSCLNPKPSKRPLMKYILKALENPLKVVRVENFNPGRLRTTSSRLSWTAGLYGSWRQSSLENATIPSCPNREGINSFKQSGRVGSQGSGGNDHSSSNKKSSEIFPEPEIQDAERQNSH